MRHFTILEVKENEQPSVVYEIDCDTAKECIDECLSVITDLFLEDEELLTTQKLRSGDYEIDGTTILVRI